MKINIRHREYLQDKAEVLDDMIYQMEKLQETAEAQSSNALRAQHVLVERALRRARSTISVILRRY